MRRRVALALASAAALVLGLAACVAEDRFSAAYTRAWCEREVACGAFSELDVCLEVQASAEATLRASIAAGRVTYDAAAGRACVRALRALRCERDEDRGAADEACDDALTGALAPGSECLLGHECAGPRATCAFDPASADEPCPVGVCRLLPGPLAAGEPCQDAPDACGDGAFCSTSGGPDLRICVAAPGSGEPCPERLCAAGLVCVGETCEPTRGPGEPCDDDDECAWPGLCVDDPLAASEAACAPRAERGEPCDRERGDEGCLAVADRCGDDGRCVARGAPGEPCEDDEACAAFARCLDGACVEPLGPGDPCFELTVPLGDGLPCYPGLVCLGGVCSHPGGDGGCPLPSEAAP